MIFFFLKKNRLNNKKRLKKDTSIEIARITCCNFPFIIKPRLLSGKNPPDEISVRDKLNESNILTPDIERSANITNVNIR